MGRAARTLYRLFLKEARRMNQENIQINMQMPMDVDAWMLNGGGHGWATPSPGYSRDCLHSLLPWLQTKNYTGTFTATDLRHCIREEFRTPAHGEVDLLDRALISLKVLSEQLHMARCSSSATTNEIRVDVTTAFVGTQEAIDPSYDPDSGEPPKYYFTYRIRISNLGSQTVQLRSRHWIIRDQSGEVVAEVAKGARGVVGCTPILKPATCFSYYSGTDLTTPLGSMEGSFDMAILNAKGLPESRFEALIAPFALQAPQDVLQNHVDEYK